MTTLPNLMMLEEIAGVWNIDAKRLGAFVLSEQRRVQREHLYGGFTPKQAHALVALWTLGAKASDQDVELQMLAQGYQTESANLNVYGTLYGMKDHAKLDHHAGPTEARWTLTGHGRRWAETHAPRLRDPLIPRVTPPKLKPTAGFVMDYQDAVDVPCEGSFDQVFFGARGDALEVRLGPFLVDVAAAHMERVQRVAGKVQPTAMAGTMDEVRVLHKALSEESVKRAQQKTGTSKAPRKGGKAR